MTAEFDAEYLTAMAKLAAGTKAAEEVLPTFVAAVAQAVVAQHLWNDATEEETGALAAGMAVAEEVMKIGRRKEEKDVAKNKDVALAAAKNLETIVEAATNAGHLQAEQRKAAAETAKNAMPDFVTAVAQMAVAAGYGQSPELTERLVAMVAKEVKLVGRRTRCDEDAKDHGTARCRDAATAAKKMQTELEKAAKGTPTSQTSAALKYLGYDLWSEWKVHAGPDNLPAKPVQADPVFSHLNPAETVSGGGIKKKRTKKRGIKKKRTLKKRGIRKNGKK